MATICPSCIHVNASHSVLRILKGLMGRKIRAVKEMSKPVNMEYFSQASLWHVPIHVDIFQSLRQGFILINVL